MPALPVDWCIRARLCFNPWQESDGCNFFFSFCVRLRFSFSLLSLDLCRWLVAQFATLAAKESDCGSAAQGGDLNFFGPGQMQKPFEDETFALKVGELSGIVDTDSGLHIILRTA